MGFIWLRWRFEIRSSWRTLVVLALVLGLGGGISLTALAGARRTDTAIGQFVSYSRPDDGAFLFGNPASPPTVSGAAARSPKLLPLEQRIVDLPQVAQYFRAPYLYLTSDQRGHAAGSLNAIGAADDDLFHSVDRPLVIAGKLPSPKRPYEVAINEFAASEHHLHVGSHLHLFSYSVNQIDNGGLADKVSSGPIAPLGPAFTVQVAGIVRFPQDINAVLPLAAKQNVSYEGQQNMYLTPAFLGTLAAKLGISIQQIPSINFVGVRLHHGSADWKQFAAKAQAIGQGKVFASQGNVYDIPSAAASAERGVHLEVVSLLLFGAIAALVTLLLISQAIARQVLLLRDDYVTLRVMGASTAQLIAIVLMRVIVIGLIGSALALVTAVLGSSLMPIGPARQGEIHLGINVDLQVLLLGFLAILAFVTLLAVIPAWRVSRPPVAEVNGRPRVAGPSSVAALMARYPLSLVIRIGVLFGLDPGRGRKKVPVLGAIVSASVAIAAVTAALSFGSSLRHLMQSPRQQGWNWSVLVGNPNSVTDQEAHGAKLLAQDHFVAGYSAIAILAGANQGTVVMDGKVVDSILAFDPLKGSVFPPLLQGHAPRGANQVVLADKTLRELHRRIGQSVQVAGPTGKLITIHIVGRMISPSAGDLFTSDMGDGGWVSGAVVRNQVANAQANAPPTVFTLFAVRFAPGVSEAAARANLRKQFGATVLRQLPSEDVINLQSVDGLPTLLAGLVVLLGLATVGNSLVSSVRRRRRDFAILRTLGFVRRQLMLVVTWQATSFSVLAVLIGVPLGILGGRWAWSLVASGIGSVSPAVVTVVGILIIIPTTLVIANLIAAAPGRMASRIAPAAEMRSE